MQIESQRASGRAVAARETSASGSRPWLTISVSVMPGTTIVSASEITVLGWVGRAAYPAEVVTGPSSSVLIDTV